MPLPAESLRSAAPTAADVMTTECVCVPAEASLASAWRLMFEAGTTHAVVLRMGHAIGVLDDRTVALEWPTGAFETHRRPVAALFLGPSATVLPETPVDDVAILMTAERVGAVAVVTDLGAPVGVVRSADVVAAVARFGLGGPAPSADHGNVRSG